MRELIRYGGLLALVLVIGACGDDGSKAPPSVQDVQEDFGPVPEDTFTPPDDIAPDVAPDVEDRTPCTEDTDCIGVLGALSGCSLARCEQPAEGGYGWCVLGFADDGAECDDGNACTTAATCVGGVCVARQGAVLDCDDGNVCTDDLCDPEIGCVHEPNLRLCDDGRVCTVNDRCRDGVCVGAPRVCDDGNPCTDGVCFEPEGCRFTNNTAPCDNNDACTANDYCSEGSCRAGAQISCDDGNPCTDDSCHSIHGCRNVMNTRPCDDGNPCTHGDRCEEGVCLSGSYLPGCPTCAADWECLPYDDGDTCTGLMACIDGQCRMLEATVVTCPPASDPCVRSRCNPETGQCEEVPLPDGVPCNDGNKCTTGDSCQGGRCVGTPARCDDGNECTESRCDPAVGCVHTPADGVACDDGDPCTGGAICSGGVCLLGPEFLCISCDGDGDCAAVDDDDLCNGVLRCYAGTCRLDPTSVVRCDTSGDDACSRTACVPATGECAREKRPDGTPCDDGLRCTLGDACDNGVCRGTPVVCDDGNQCTEGICQESTGGCVHIERDWPCDNGNLCTVGDLCSGGICVAGPVRDCDDDNICTVNSCSPTEGCIATPIDRECDDGDACTLDDRCVDGECRGTPIDCDDGNLCTQDRCDPRGVCTHTPVAGPCDDGNICTVGDYCDAGACISGTPRVCDDGNVCTVGRCVIPDGCVYDPVPGPCSDGDPCTTGDRCVDGECVPTGTLECDDLNPCTDNTCVAGVGCVFVPNSDPCDDGNLCTTDDRCVDGACVGGPPPNCDDGNVCTDNSCEPALGCVTSNNTGPCSDGNPCTHPDRCDAGMCVSGPNICTETICDDGIDNSLNGLTDCDDPDCWDDDACLPCEPVKALTCGETIQGSLRGSLNTTDLFDEYSCSALDFSGREMAFAFNATCLQQVEIAVRTTDLGGAGGKTYKQLYAFALADEFSRCDAKNCTHVAAPVERAAGYSIATLRFPVLYNNTYYVVIDGLQGDEAAFTMFVTCTPVYTMETCGNGIDDDCDGLTDCDDPDCFSHASCRP